MDGGDSQGKRERGGSQTRAAEWGPQGEDVDGGEKEEKPPREQRGTEEGAVLQPREGGGQ